MQIGAEAAELADTLRSVAHVNAFWRGVAASHAEDRLAHLSRELDVVAVAYQEGGRILQRYAIRLGDVQHEERAATRSALRAAEDLADAERLLAAATAHDTAAAATAHANGMAAPPATAPRCALLASEARNRLEAAQARAAASREEFAGLAQRTAALLESATPPPLPHQRWWRQLAHRAGQWTSRHWKEALRNVAKFAESVATMATVAALAIAAVGVLFPPLEVLAAATETIAAVSGATATLATATVNLSDPRTRGAGFIELAEVALPGPARKMAGKLGIDALEAPTSMAIRRPKAPRDVPLGFRDKQHFEAFGAILHRRLAALGYPNAVGVMQGSSVTGFRFRTGKPFDVGKRSDLDVALCDPDLFDLAETKNIPIRKQPPLRTAPLKGRMKEALQALELYDLRAELTDLMGREVEFMIYRFEQSALYRSPSIEIPRIR